MDHSQQAVLSARCIGDTHKKQKERAAQTGQYLDNHFDEGCGLHPARKFIYEAQFLNPQSCREVPRTTQIQRYTRF